MSWAPHPFQAEQNPLAWPLPWWDQGRPGARCPQPRGHGQAHPGGLRQQGLAVGGVQGGTCLSHWEQWAAPCAPPLPPYPVQCHPLLPFTACHEPAAPPSCQQPPYAPQR